MRFHRILGVKLHTEDPDHDVFHAETGKVLVNVQKLGTSKVSPAVMLLDASVAVNKTDVYVSQRKLEISTIARQLCDQAAEEVANTLALASGAKRQIFAFACGFALSEIPENRKSEFIDIEPQHLTTRQFVRPKLMFDMMDHALGGRLGGRELGIALLAETFATDHSVSIYRDLVRFFEIAFKLPFKDKTNLMEQKLNDFLGQTNNGFNAPEISEWTRHRHGATHADLNRTKDLVFESQVSPLIKRMRQAAYDVLFNKKNWHSKDAERDVVYSPTASMKGADQTSAQAGHAMRFEVAVRDSFDSFPVELETSVLLPPNYWVPAFANPIKESVTTIAQ